MNFTSLPCEWLPKLKTGNFDTFDSLKLNQILYRIASGTFWSLIGTILARLFSITATVVIARLLGVADFGAYGMVQSTLEMLGVFAGFSLGSTSSKFLAEYKTKDKEKAGRILSLTNGLARISSGAIGLFVYLSSSWIASETLQRTDLAPLLSLGAIYLFITTQNNVQIGSLLGFEAFKETAKINVIQGIITSVVAIPLVFFFSLQGAVISLIVSAFVGYFLCRNELNKKCKENNILIHRLDKSIFKEWPIIWNFAIPSLVSGLLVMPVSWLTNALLVHQPNGYSELGLFNAANQLRQFIIILPNILSTILLPIFSDVYGNRSEGEFRYIFQFNIKLTWMVALPATILIVALREVVFVVFGEKYSGVDMLFVPLMITAFLTIMNNIVGTAIAGAGRMWLGATFNLCWAIAMIICSIFLIPRFGGMGLAVSYMIAYMLHTGWQIVYTEKKLMPGSVKDFTGLLFLTIFTIIPVYVLAVLNTVDTIFNLPFLIAACIPIIKLAKNNYRAILKDVFGRHAQAKTISGKGLAKAASQPTLSVIADGSARRRQSSASAMDGIRRPETASGQPECSEKPDNG